LIFQSLICLWSIVAYRVRRSNFILISIRITKYPSLFEILSKYKQSKKTIVNGSTPCILSTSDLCLTIRLRKSCLIKFDSYQKGRNKLVMLGDAPVVLALNVMCRRPRSFQVRTSLLHSSLGNWPLTQIYQRTWDSEAFWLSATCQIFFTVFCNLHLGLVIYLYF
jgi:hypothetical protein